MINGQTQWEDETGWIVAFVEAQTGLRSRWSKSILVLDDRSTEALQGRRVLAEKRWNCDILVHESLNEKPLRWRSLLHEVLHSVSAGMNEEEYRRFRGWEEGVVEWLQRKWRPTMLQSLGISLPSDFFEAYERVWPFRGYLEALETLQAACDHESEQFYLHLLQTPLSLRPAKVRSWGTDADFLPLFARTIGKLR